MTAVRALQSIAHLEPGVGKRRNAGDDGKPEPATFTFAFATHEARAQLRAQRGRDARAIVSDAEGAG